MIYGSKLAILHQIQHLFLLQKMQFLRHSPHLFHTKASYSRSDAQNQKRPFTAEGLKLFTEKEFIINGNTYLFELHFDSSATNSPQISTYNSYNMNNNNNINNNKLTILNNTLIQYSEEIHIMSAEEVNELVSIYNQMVELYINNRNSNNYITNNNNNS